MANSRSEKVFFNFSILAAQQIFVNILSIVVVGYAARVLGKEDYGIYSLAFAFPAVFSPLGHLGLRALTIREVANRKNPAEYLNKIIPVRIFLGFFMGLIVVGSAYLFGYSKIIIYAIMIATVSFVFENLSRIIVDVFQGIEEMGNVAIRDISVRIFTGILSIVLLYQGYGLYEICMLYALGSLLGLLINMYLYVKKFGVLEFSYDLSFVLTNIKEGFPFILIGFSTIFLMKTDILIISKMLDFSAVGIYNAAANLFYRLSFVCDAIATATFPAIASLYFKNNHEASKVLSNSVKYMMIIAFPMCLGGFMLSGDIISLIYGNQYQGTTTVFSILICGIPFMFFTTLFHYSIGAIKQQKFVMYVLIGMAVLNIIFNIILIPLFGILGAAMATLAIQGSTFLLFCFKIFQYFRFHISGRVLLSIVIALLVMGAGLTVVSEYSLFLSIPIGVTLYCVVFFFLAGSEVPLLKFINFRKVIK